MPSVVEESKGRAKLFDTLDRTGTHFIAVGSGSGSSSPSSSSCGSSGYRHDQEEGGVAREGLAAATTGGRARTKEGADRRAEGRLDRARRKRDGDEELLEAQGGVAGGGGGGGGDGSSMSVRYNRVATDRGGSSPASDAENSKRRRSQLAERISNKLHALFWAVVGAIVAYHTDFVRVLIEDERVDRFWFNLGVVCFSINVVILAYLTVWLPHVRGVKVSWNVYSPRAIPTATVVGLICALSLNFALWNVWGFLTPLILFAVFIGCLFTLHFVPWPC